MYMYISDSPTPVAVSFALDPTSSPHLSRCEASTIAPTSRSHTLVLLLVPPVQRSGAALDRSRIPTAVLRGNHAQARELYCSSTVQLEWMAIQPGCSVPMSHTLDKSCSSVSFNSTQLTPTCSSRARVCFPQRTSETLSFIVDVMCSAAYQRPVRYRSRPCRPPPWAIQSTLPASARSDS